VFKEASRLLSYYIGKKNQEMKACYSGGRYVMDEMCYKKIDNMASVF
jgi:hypothetical protein